MTRARTHFDEDILRAESPLTMAVTQGLSESVSSDLRRHAVAAAVGALDAYLCDTYVDLLASALVQARTKATSLPSAYRKEQLPAGPLLAAYNKRPNWGLRMAARLRMEKDNMLQISRVPDMFNPALPQGQKLWNDLMPAYLALNRKRLTHFTAAEFAAVPSQQKSKALTKARGTLIARIGTIIQRRHDIVHNCDRPRQAVTALTQAAAKKMIRDIRDLIEILDSHVEQHRTA